MTYVVYREAHGCPGKAWGPIKATEVGLWDAHGWVTPERASQYTSKAKALECAENVGGVVYIRVHTDRRL